MGHAMSLLMTDIGEALAGMYFPKAAIKVQAGKQASSQEEQGGRTDNELS